MKHLIAGSVATFAAVCMLVSPVFAADPQFSPSWSGCRLGATVGLASTEAQTKDLPFEEGLFAGSGASWNSGGPPYETIDSDGTGVTGGLVAGCDIEVPGERASFVFGVMGDISAMNADAEGQSSISSDTHVGYDLSWATTLRARAGIATGNWLFYGTGGFAAADLSLDVSDDIGPGLLDLSESGLRGGWVIGAGVELQINERWSAMLEYQHIQFDGLTATGAAIDPVDAVPRFDGDIDVNILRLGLLLRL